MTLKELAKAGEVYQKAIDIDPNCQVSLLMYQKAIDMDPFAKYILMYQRAIDINPFAKYIFIVPESNEH